MKPKRTLRPAGPGRDSQVLRKLIIAGRMEPMLRDRSNNAGRPYHEIYGWRRKVASRFKQEFTLQDPRPWQEPRAILRETRGAVLVYDERRRQIDVIGFTAESDDKYTDNQLVKASAAYAFYATLQEGGKTAEEIVAIFTDKFVAEVWPWCSSWWKPSQDPVRNRAKAGALLWADADRLRRARSTGKQFQNTLDSVDSNAAHIDRWLSNHPEAA